MIRILAALVLSFGFLATPAHAQSLGPSDGDLAVWTKLMSNGVQAKFYAKFPQVGQKVQFMQQDDQGTYQEIAWIRVEADDLNDAGEYQNLNNGHYFVRTVDLREGKNRLRILVDGQVAFGTVTYSVSEEQLGQVADDQSTSVAPAPETSELELEEPNVELEIGTVSSESIALSWIAPPDSDDVLLTIDGFERNAQVSFGRTQTDWVFLGLWPGEDYLVCAEVRKPLPLDRVCEVVTTAGTRDRPAAALPIESAWITSSSEDAISLAWEPVSGASRYSVAWTKSDGDSWSQAGTQASEFTLQNLEPGTAYRIELRAYSAELGLGASYFLTTSTNGEPTAPLEQEEPAVSFTASIGEVTENGIQILWESDVALDRVGLSYSVWQSTSWTSTARSAASNSFWVTGLEPGTTYDIRLTPVLNGQSLMEVRTQGVTAGEKYVEPEPVIDPPTNLMVSSLTATSASLTWTSPAGDVVRMSLMACWNTSCTSIGVSGTSGTVAGLNAGLPYSIWVTAFMADGSQQVSTKISVLMPSA